MTTPIALILEERQKQIDKGRDVLHDVEFYGDKQDLAIAASCYTLPEHLRQFSRTGRPDNFPWVSLYWKPRKDRLKELAMAGALIVAEMEKIQYLQSINLKD